MTRRKLYLIGLLLTLVCTISWATDGPTNAKVLEFYAGANGLKGSALKTKMYELINPNGRKNALGEVMSTPSYDGLWNAYKKTDVTPQGYIWDMYSNVTKYTPGGNAQGANYSGEGDSYNREHSVPQSWFGGSSPMVSDLFHVVPVDGYINNTRDSYIFYKVTKIDENKCSKNMFSKFGTSTVNGKSGEKVFEPNDEYKGDFARIYFYMVTAYQAAAASSFRSTKGNATVEIFKDDEYKPFQDWYLTMLMEWAKNDPVSEKEINRNNAVYTFQKNRNPFVDYPGLEDLIWGKNTATSFDYANYTNPYGNGSSGGTPDDPTACGLAYSSTTATAILGATYNAPTLKNPNNVAPITYSSSNKSVATIDASGNVSILATGTTTITASFAGNTNYQSGSASYVLTVSKQQTVGKYYFAETFDKCNGLGGNDKNWSGSIASTSIESKPDTYTDNAGWKFIKGFEASKCIKLGTGSSKGSATTPTIKGLNGKTETLHFKAAAWDYDKEGTTLNITGTGCKLSTSSVTLVKGKWTEYYINITGTADEVKITFESDKSSNNRFFLDEVNIPNTTASTLRGDINGDDEVSVEDLTRLVDILLGNTTDTNGSADVNDDGKVNSEDIGPLVDIILERAS
ncbi:MAG: endonuclease [Bacteroidaceae bacterium]|nr:endonuclease [Bacteroidaceae bacterium]